MPPHIVFGAGGIGASRFAHTWTTPEQVSTLLTALSRLDILELDSAATYPPGNPWHANTLLGQSRAWEQGFVLDDKVLILHDGGPSLHDAGIASSIDRSLTLLGVDRLRTLYAHAPDRGTPLEVSAKAFDRQWRSGKFERLGLSNYGVEDLRRYFEICDELGLVKPTVYQGNYNAIWREAEDELLPLLRKHGCAFYAYSPLAGGFLTGKVTFARDRTAELDKTRWANTTGGYPKRFDKPEMHAAVRKLKTACDAAAPPFSLQEASLRWIMNHSALRDGDAIIVGATRIDQLEANVEDAGKGPLEGDVLEAVEGLWKIVLDSGEDGG